MITNAVAGENLKRWVEAWLKQYPDYDEPLSNLRGLPYFTRDQVESLVKWKYPEPRKPLAAWRYNHIRALVHSNDAQAVIHATEAAFTDQNDSRALAHVTELRGVGQAIGSTILTAHNPARFTVYDWRASKSLIALGYLDKRHRSSWRAYLDGCRAVAAATGRKLRDVDRALYSAKGRVTRPES